MHGMFGSDLVRLLLRLHPGDDGSGRIDAGSADADSITGTPAADLLLGLAGGDSIRGEAGDDVILGGDGADRILGDGETGPAPLFPGETEEERAGPLPGDNLILAGAGDDTVIAGWGSDTVLGGDGDDLLTGYGGGFPSPAGFDLLLRLDGPDLLVGGSGNDVLQGGGSDDTLWGGAGADTLEGGYGADRLAGGPGDDRFVFRRQDPFGSSTDTGIGPGERDLVLDFRPGDKLDFSSYRLRGADGPDPLFLGTDDFVASGALQVRYEQLEEEGLTLVQFLRGSGADRTVPPEEPTGEVALLGLHRLDADDVII